MTAQQHAHLRFRRAIERRALWLDAARELPNLPLEDALQLVHLSASRYLWRCTSESGRASETLLRALDAGGGAKTVTSTVTAP